MNPAEFWRLSRNYCYCRHSRSRELEDVESVDIATMLEGLRDSFAPVLITKDLTLTISAPENTVVPGESFLIRQAFANMIQNAIAFSPRSAGIAVTARPDSGGIAITVTDNGEGIPTYAADRVFERFYSLKRPDTCKKSTGLGLSLVKEVAKLHDGSITLEPNPAGGAIARLWLSG